MKKLYSNRRLMKKRICAQESQLAMSLANLNKLTGTSGDMSQIESDMEWFLTWRVKLMDFPETMWCDGVQNLQLMTKNGLSYYLQAKIWLGPERDVNIEYLCDLEGIIELSQNRKKLKSYNLRIEDKGRFYFARKAT